MITDSSALVTVAEEQRGRLPTRGHPRDADATETYHIPLVLRGRRRHLRVVVDGHGQYIDLCFAADASEIVLSEQQYNQSTFDRVATVRAYATAAAKRAAVVKEDNLLAKTDIQ
eukprot:51337-Pyramimonas_sp.AAC.1